MTQKLQDGVYGDSVFGLERAGAVVGYLTSGMPGKG